MEFCQRGRFRVRNERKQPPSASSSPAGSACPSTATASPSGNVSPSDAARNPATFTSTTVCISRTASASEAAGNPATVGPSRGRRRPGSYSSSTPPQQCRPQVATFPTSSPPLEFQHRPPTPMPNCAPQANQFQTLIQPIPTNVPHQGFVPQAALQISSFPQFSWRPLVHQVVLGPAILRKKDEGPADYATKFDELCDGSRGFILQIEAKIQEYREESEQLGQCGRLHDIPTDYFELQSKRILQEIQGIMASVKKQQFPVEEMLFSARATIRHVEAAVHSCMQLFHERNKAATYAAPNFYKGIPRRPSTYMHETLKRFENNLPELLKRIEELEVILQFPSSSRCSIESIPSIMSNLHQILMHVSAKVEETNHIVALKKKNYLASQCRMGNSVNPFLAADRQEAARQKAAAERVHTTLQLSNVLPKPTAPYASPFVSPVMVSPVLLQQPTGCMGAPDGLK
ncbi:hypothetical protein AXF42_Ash010325 [Apostasia shenzhenica]|uniref:Uncharacterized protein n=1 Tax=Apostasia shenzhenica TaxID=1088818 RepID=A0A2I0BDR7_9ASPA|nr:hypothetical protein AXF42_Ash010325 [Apostasia shenzhenica]